MKKIIYLGLVSTCIFAQQPNGNMDYNLLGDKFYMQMKSNLPLTKNMIESLKKTKVCLNNSKTKDEAKKCGDEIAKVVDDNSKAVMNSFGIDDSQIKESIKEEEDEFDKIQWNDKEKKKAIEKIDDAIKESWIHVKCLENNKDLNSFNQCMKKAGRVE